ncbi:DUF1983 domain-containing protein [Pseudomonas sp. FP2335]|uniref:phage tail tip fiber protein n=1 Tax=Pseudomonas sp. FP2335 TaxID=2954092 RepID=UPI002733B142|nr:DUF1983 domain-containing protein [Pseudomonas sp. FP2335]WLH76856.1 DUF1983 domain-containing protein [Pseudomonas sp. FP2335]
MSGTIQSSNYVPGVSGWKLDHVSGDFEINSAQIQVGTLPSDPQLITVTAGSWSQYDLPANALERLSFIGAELEKVPAECRASAEFTTEDISFDRDGSDVRTSLTYERHETAEEVAARQARARVAGTRITQTGGLTTIFIDGVTRFRCGGLTKAEQPQPFVVADGQVFVDQAFIDDGSIKKTKIANDQLTNMWSVRLEISQAGKSYAAGFGIGVGTASDVNPDIIVKASYMEILPDGLVKITQAPKYSR